MASTAEIKESFRQAVLDAYLIEYKELSETGRGLESKAQGSIAVAGIFIAAAFAYIRDITPIALSPEKILLGLAILLLVLSVILSILALRVRKVTAPPLGEFTHYYIKDLLQVTDEAAFQEYLPVVFNDHATRWLNIKQETYKLNQIKARYLWSAQLFLMASILTVALLTLIKLFG